MSFLRNLCSTKIQNKFQKISIISQQSNTFDNKYKSLLDQRDRVLIFPFNFQIDFSHFSASQNIQMFLSTVQYETILINIQSYLVSVFQTILSISFKYLNEGKLDQKEAQDYASKNILQNVKNILRQIMKIIVDQKIVLPQDSVLFKTRLIQDTDLIMKNILKGLTKHYPQAPPTGGTPKMREVITSIDRSQDQRNDFIYANNILIDKWLKIQTKINKKTHQQHYQVILSQQTIDYTGYIMQVVNKIIEVTQSNNHQKLNKSIYQSFVQFTEKLICISQHQYCSKLLQTLKLQSSNNQKMNIASKHKNQQNCLALFFSDLLEGKEQDYLKTALAQQNNHKILENIVKMVLNENKKSQIIPYSTSSQNIFKKTQLYEYSQLQNPKNNQNNLQQVNSKSQKILMKILNNQKFFQMYNKDKKYQIGSKIPNYVKKFSSRDISNKNFSSKNASILRIITKWSQYLQQIFDNPDSYISKRLYQFKDLKNNLIQTNQDLQQQLIKRINNEREIVHKKISKLQQVYSSFTAYFLGKPFEKMGYYAQRYEQIRSTSSQINSVMLSLMIQYLSILIHHLLKVGSNIQIGKDDDSKHFNINLIVLKVTDLMRSKVQLQQKSFINIMKILNILDQQNNIDKYFKLVRIKNKLDTKDNNVMINFLFMQKIQCQMQLSIQNIKQKTKNYYNFSHFIYQLTRGKFGVFAQLGIMISQHDYKISSSQGQYYLSKKNNFKILKNKKNNQDLPNHSNIKICGQCQLLSIRQNIPISSQHKYMCSTCIGKKPSPSFYFKQNNKFTQLSVNLQQFNKINDYHDILKAYLNIQQRMNLNIDSRNMVDNQNQFNSKKILKIMELNKKRGTFDIWLIWWHDRQMKWFKIPLNKQMLKIKKQLTNINYDQISIQDKIYNNKKIQQLTYCLNNKIETYFKILNLLNFQDLTERKIQNYIESFQLYRIQNLTIKMIQSKSQIINVDGDHLLKQNLQSINLFKQTKLKNQDGRFQSIKNKDISFNNIKQIHASLLKLNQLPQWITKCKNITKINLNWNHFQKIPPFKSHFIIQKLQQISLMNNNIKILDELVYFSSLKVLNLSKNNIKSLRGMNINSISQLDISYNQLKNVNQLFRITEANIINISFNSELQNVSGLKYLKKIRNLLLNNNNISKLQDFALQKIQYLNLSSNQIQKIVNFKQLQYIYKLNLYNNRINKIIDKAHLPLIRQLDLRSNGCSNISGLSSLNQILILYLSYNRITSLEGLQNLQKAQILQLSYNQIKNIGSLKNLIQANYLDLSQNKINSLDILSKLISCDKLFISTSKQHQIIQIPSNIPIQCQIYIKVSEPELFDKIKNKYPQRKIIAQNI